MDDSNFFELQYKPRNNKIYALHFTYDNIDKLFQCLYRFMIDAKFILCADATIQLHMFDTKNSQINNRTCIGDYIIFILNDRGNLEICILEKHAHKISLNINGDATVIYAFDYIAYDREWCEPYIGRIAKTTLKERYGIEEC